MIAENAATALSARPLSDVRNVRALNGLEALIRPLHPDDHALYTEFSRHITPEDHRLRFFSAAGALSPARAWGFTHYDRREARAYIALDPVSGVMLGVGRVHRTGPEEGEFAVLVRSDLKGHGLGHALMDCVLSGAADLQVRTVWGLVLRENTHMLALARDLGFTVTPFSGELGVLKVRRGPTEIDAQPHRTRDTGA